MWTDLGFSETQVASAPITLAEAGIDKNLADHARKFAAIADDEFNNIVGGWWERAIINLAMFRAAGQFSVC